VALVGYTNAGKSTLFNRLTGAESFAADQLFATLDTTLRRLVIPGAAAIVLSDTVGFTRELPHDPIAAFQATPKRAVDADLPLHVVDASHPGRDAQIAAVDAVLAEISRSRAADPGGEQGRRGRVRARRQARRVW
jgi:GTP-binding protein HflX